MKLGSYQATFIYALITLAVLALSGCGKPYVGNTVDTSREAFCRVYGFPTECTKNNYEHFVIYTKITKVDDNGNYRINGYFDPTQGSLKSWGSLLRANSQFRMIFVSDDIIFDNKVLPVKGTDMGQKLTFEFDYHTDLPIEAVAFTYKFHVRG